MCFPTGAPSSGAAAAPAPVAAVQAPAPPANRDPKAPVIEAAARNARDTASAQRAGTSAFRNDLSIPVSGGAVGTGLSVPS